MVAEATLLCFKIHPSIVATCNFLTHSHQKCYKILPKFGFIQHKYRI